MRLSTFAGVAAAVLPTLVRSWVSTDTLQDADSAQSGYLPNHPIDPSKLSSWTTQWTGALLSTQGELVHAKPLVWTPPGGGNELVIVVSNLNIVRVWDGITGTLVAQRQLDPPFASTDANCGDIPGNIGITATPVIDKNTNIMYFTSKGYKGGKAGPIDTISGQYKVYAVTLPTLTDISGWPYIIANKPATNDLTRYFVAGTVLQRSAITQLGNTLVLPFGGHCDNFNYTSVFFPFFFTHIPPARDLNRIFQPQPY